MADVPAAAVQGVVADVVAADVAISANSSAAAAFSVNDIIFAFVVTASVVVAAAFDVPVVAAVPTAAAGANAVVVAVDKRPFMTERAAAAIAATHGNEVLL